MSSQVVVGTQWGDEGKGKIVDVLAEKADMIVRFQGGDNAGHTVIVNGKKYVLHLLPSGVLHKDAVCVIGPGVVCNPFVLLEEMDTLEKGGLTCDHIVISDRAQILMPYHRYQDKLEEESANHKIGTTQKGIGPCYSDKYARRGIRYHELLDFESFKVRLKEVLDFKNKLFTNVYGANPLDYDTIVKDFEKIYDRIVPMIKETTHMVNEALDQNKNVLFEGAQAMMLDINYGTYPYVTSSSPTSAGVATGTGVAVNRLQTIIGVVKAYSTRVGEGPFVTELLDSTGENLRAVGAEYGATTGRPRRCGWLDLLVVKHACTMTGLTDIVLTKIDVFDTFDEIKICIAYKDSRNGTIYTSYPEDVFIHKYLEPVYETHKGWGVNISNIRKYEDLPENARKYLERLEEILETQISIVSVGPDRYQTIFKK